MAEIPKFVQDDSSNDSSLDSAEDFGIKYTDRYAKLQSAEVESLSTPRRGYTKARMPTRRPDPNIYNRNALMARENRRKKKAYLETIEKELEHTRSANKALLKALKKQIKVAHRLEQEKMYFKNIVANHTDIMNTVSTLQQQPLTRSSKRINTGDLSSLSYEGSQTSCSSSYDTQTPHNSDFDASAFNGTWNELIDENFGLKQIGENSSSNPIENNSYNIDVEHGYVTPPTTLKKSKLDSDPGICLHISNGKLSVEFCPSCHWSSYNTLPTQLLTGETAN